MLPEQSRAKTTSRIKMTSFVPEEISPGGKRLTHKIPIQKQIRFLPFVIAGDECFYSAIIPVFILFWLDSLKVNFPCEPSRAKKRNEPNICSDQQAERGRRRAHSPNSILLVILCMFVQKDPDRYSLSLDQRTEKLISWYGFHLFL